MDGQFYSNTVMVHWPLMDRLLHLVQRGWAFFLEIFEN